MGRTEKEIVTTNTALRDLAEWLRDQRARAGLTYRELAERAGVHATTLQRVASGDSIPRLMPVLAFARGCDARPEDARSLWLKARTEHARSGAPYSRQPAPAPVLIRDFADLSAALRELYEAAGAPSQRTMEVRAGGFGALPRSSAYRIVNKLTVPHCLEQFQAYLRACEVPVAAWGAWEDAWGRAWRFEKQEDAGLTEIQLPAYSRARDAYVLARELVSERRVMVNSEDGTIAEVQDGPRFHRPLAPRQRRVDGIVPVSAVEGDGRLIMRQRRLDLTLPASTPDADGHWVPRRTRGRSRPGRYTEATLFPLPLPAEARRPKSEDAGALF
ncbi:multiprotein-bridging factor 1 family protein [Streptomyces beijiangensis]|uniref:helix-turn-helix domain-containing protein n=1 Tax=Streptomyces beijiangensis TaxID=163361 RepID=UPI0031DC3CE1